MIVNIEKEDVIEYLSDLSSDEVIDIICSSLRSYIVYAEIAELLCDRCDGYLERYEKIVT